MGQERIDTVLHDSIAWIERALLIVWVPGIYVVADMAQSPRKWHEVLGLAGMVACGTLGFLRAVQESRKKIEEEDINGNI